MQEFQIVKLHLRSPLYYVQADDLKYPMFTADAGECLFGFEIEAGQYRNIEPEAAVFIGNGGAPFFRGRLSPLPPASCSLLPTICSLETGLYLFMQCREAVDWEGILTMALEIQKEGLWEGFTLDRKLFLRYVFEDGAMVTQVWRPALGMERP
jgi:hypothetical protein